MKPITAATAAFLLSASIATAADKLDYREMEAIGDGAVFVVTNQPCEIDFNEPTKFIYHGYVIFKGVEYEACWYGEDAAIWMAVDHFKQIVSLDPNAFRPRQSEFKGVY